MTNLKPIPPKQSKAKKDTNKEVLLSGKTPENSHLQGTKKPTTPKAAHPSEATKHKQQTPKGQPRKRQARTPGQNDASANKTASKSQAVPPTQDSATVGNVVELFQETLLNLQQNWEDHAELTQLILTDPFRFQDSIKRFTQDRTQHAESVFESFEQHVRAMQDIWLNGLKQWFADAPQTTQNADKTSTQKKKPTKTLFDQIYDHNKNWLLSQVAAASTLTDSEKQKLGFFFMHVFSAANPRNTLLANPEAMQETIDTKGENLLKGTFNFLEDLKNSKRGLQVPLTDLNAFTVGENCAATAGQVIFRNEQFELIEFAPTTQTQFTNPLLIIPPWINKYYILDLEQHNSFIRQSLEQGFRVLTISWRNPEAEHKHWQFSDYATNGVLKAMEVIRYREPNIALNVLGYCIGGTLLTASLAYLSAQSTRTRKQHAAMVPPIASLTLLTTLLDFENAGDLKIFTNEESIEQVEAMMAKKGLLDASILSQTFAMLRPQNLYWSAAVENYLFGRRPKPMALLFWNADSVRMPAPMMSYYLREFYLHNHLAKGQLELLGVRVDLNQIAMPVYAVSTIQDHIAPWEGCFASAQKMTNADVRFILSDSGHIAGVINPPKDTVKYGYQCQEAGSKEPKTAEQWLASAHRVQQSWWPDWWRWLSNHAGGKAAVADITKQYKHKTQNLGSAPGSYVRVRS